MIYEVYLDEKILYYPGDLENAIFNSKLEQALNDAGTFEFDVPVTNPLHRNIENRRSMVQILKDGKEIFCGEVREAEDDLYMTKHVYAVGELAFLYDSIQPQGKYQNQTPLQFFSTLINNHNAQVEEKKQFQVGVVTVSDPNDSIYRFTNYEDTLTCLREKLCESLGGYLRIRKVDGVRYLDLVKLQDYGTTCEQPIEFGENLLDYACNASGVDIVTAVIPLGARLDESTIEGLDAYTDIKSVNDGKDYVYLPEAISRFGWIKKVVHWNDVTEPANLKKKAEEWLKENQYELLTLEVNALDLSMLNSGIDSFNLGDSVNALAEPYGMDAWFPVQKMTTYLQEPEKNELVLSNTIKKSYTQQMTELTNQITGEMPQQSSMLEQAKKNASNLIKIATNGYIVLNMDEQGNPKELLIMDTKDISTAKKVWRWNINGLGYSSTGYDGEYGLAMTMDGHFVADAIIVDGLEVGKNVTMGPDATIKWQQVENQPDIPTSSQMTQITKDTVTTAYVNALGVKAGSVDAENITGIKISGKAIETNDAIITGGNINIETAEAGENVIDLRCGDVKNVMGPFGNQCTADTRKATFMMSNITVENETPSGIVIAQLTDAGKGISSYGWDSYSDVRLKYDIELLDIQERAKFIYAQEPCRFKYNYDPDGYYRHGLIAQRVQETIEMEKWAVVSENTGADGETYLTLNYMELIADLIATVQELNERVKKLESEE